MKNNCVMTLVLIVALMMMVVETWAQEDESGEFTLEEILVTAEKREVNVQNLPSSIMAIDGEDLAQQGKISTAQMLESIPNVRFEEGGQAAAPNSTIAIRGVRYKQTSDGQPAAATATYVDGVFQGYGANLDIGRIEVLRGPQGTLYGRSATGGVVSFHTKSPELSRFGGNISLETGEASLINAQAAVNVPVGDTFAFRAAGRYYERDGYHNPEGGYTGAREGRLKAYYQPTDAFDITLNFTINEEKSNTGGYAARLLSPGGEIDYKDTETDVVEGVWVRGLQGSATVNYDFDGSILTYIGSWRKYKNDESPGDIDIRPAAQIMNNQRYNYGEEFRTHELRLASDSDGKLSWLLGGSYYYSDYDRSEVSIQVKDYYADGTEVTLPESINAPIFRQSVSGEIENFGIFTEETYSLRDDMRITAGLRYDMTNLSSFSSYDFNVNVEPLSEASLNPPTWEFFSILEKPEFENTTYKLRFEYDLTPDNMLYALTATGFQPGDVRLSNQVAPGDDGYMDVTFFVLPYDEEKLTSYEIGSKNRFFDNRLQLNLSLFYYDYEGFRHTVNTALAGPPVFTVVATPLEMTGAELATELLITPKDRVTFDVGLLDAKITSYPTIPEIGSLKQYLQLERLPGLPEMTANLAYSHDFILVGGSTLVPRVEMRYTSGMYVANLTEDQIEADLKPYAYQDAYVITDIGITWTSAAGKYSVSGYARNLFDTEYLTDVDVESGVNAVGVSVGDPLTWGLMANVRF